MHLVCRTLSPAREREWGLLHQGLYSALPRDWTLSDILRTPICDLKQRCSTAIETNQHEIDRTDLVTPVDSLTEIWAAGVTYKRSWDARTAENITDDVYTRVYRAKRPELFFKSIGWRVSGPGDLISFPPDAYSTVPEPELALVINVDGDIVGYTICNDVTARSIEAENPLYLPQAKIFLGGCAIGPMIRPAWECPDASELTIRAYVYREDKLIWNDTAQVADMQRGFDELIQYLYAANNFPNGAILATGTDLVPPPEFSLAPSDVVRIEIDQIGTLINKVIGHDAYH